jgi:hypothetical protein
MSTVSSPPPARRRRTGIRAAVVATVLAVVSAGLFWFQPWKLWVDDRVDAPLPTASAAADDEERATPPTTPAETEPAELRRGAFISRDHSTAGTARVLELPDGSRFLRLEELDTENGPDLYVYLSTVPADGDEAAFDDDVVSLGRLQGNLGNQNYELPAELDLSRFASVVIWCDRFNSAFGAADLSV